jgi:RHS repeat-associated protein
VPTGGDDDERFTTYKRSQTTGLDYAVNRFYSAELGRFLQTDPLGLAAYRPGDSQSFNAYSYVRNDPIGRIDPSGLLEPPGCKIVGKDDKGNPIYDCPFLEGADVTVVGEPFTNFGPQASSRLDRGSGPNGPLGAPAGDAGDQQGKNDRPCKPAPYGYQYDGSLGGKNWSPFATLNGPRDTTSLDKLAMAWLTAPVAVAGTAWTVGAGGTVLVDKLLYDIGQKALSNANFNLVPKVFAPDILGILARGAYFVQTQGWLAATFSRNWGKAILLLPTGLTPDAEVFVAGLVGLGGGYALSRVTPSCSARP